MIIIIIMVTIIISLLDLMGRRGSWTMTVTINGQCCWLSRPGIGRFYDRHFALNLIPCSLLLSGINNLGFAFHSQLHCFLVFQPTQSVSNNVKDFSDLYKGTSYQLCTFNLVGHVPRHDVTWQQRLRTSLSRIHNLKVHQCMQFKTYS